jgi:hypothetical protein
MESPFSRVMDELLGRLDAVSGGTSAGAESPTAREGGFVPLTVDVSRAVAAGDSSTLTPEQQVQYRLLVQLRAAGLAQVAAYRAARGLPSYDQTEDPWIEALSPVPLPTSAAPNIPAQQVDGMSIFMPFSSGIEGAPAPDAEAE